MSKLCFALNEALAHRRGAVGHWGHVGIRLPRSAVVFELVLVGVGIDRARCHGVALPDLHRISLFRRVVDDGFGISATEGAGASDCADNEGLSKGSMGAAMPLAFTAEGTG